MESARLDLEWSIVANLNPSPKSYITRVTAKNVNISSDTLSDDFIELDDIIITGNIYIRNSKVRLYNGIIDVNIKSLNTPLIYIENSVFEINDTFIWLNSRNIDDFILSSNNSDIILNRVFIIEYNNELLIHPISADNYKLYNSTILDIKYNRSTFILENPNNFSIKTRIVQYNST